MTSVWKRLQRVGKKASKFQFVASYQELMVECTKKWQPDKLRVVWTRRNRRICSKLHGWQPGIKNPYRGMVVWLVPENVDITATLFRDPQADTFEDKDWTFVIENETKGQRKVLASVDVNLKKFASATLTQTDLTLKLKPLSVKVVEATLKLSISCVFLREGKATDEDMQSLASLMSVKPTDIGNLDDFNESDEEEDRRSSAGARLSKTAIARERERRGSSGSIPSPVLSKRPPLPRPPSPSPRLAKRSRHAPSTAPAQQEVPPYSDCPSVPGFTRAHPPALPKIFQPNPGSVPVSFLRRSSGDSGGTAVDSQGPAPGTPVQPQPRPDKPQASALSQPPSPPSAPLKEVKLPEPQALSQSQASETPSLTLGKGDEASCSPQIAGSIESAKQRRSNPFAPHPASEKVREAEAVLGSDKEKAVKGPGKDGYPVLTEVSESAELIAALPPPWPFSVPEPFCPLLSDKESLSPIPELFIAEKPPLAEEEPFFKETPNETEETFSQPANQNATSTSTQEKNMFTTTKHIMIGPALDLENPTNEKQNVLPQAAGMQASPSTQNPFKEPSSQTPTSVVSQRGEINKATLDRLVIHPSPFLYNVCKDKGKIELDNPQKLKSDTLIAPEALFLGELSSTGRPTPEQVQKEEQTVDKNPESPSPPPTPPYHFELNESDKVKEIRNNTTAIVSSSSLEISSSSFLSTLLQPPSVEKRPLWVKDVFDPKEVERSKMDIQTYSECVYPSDVVNSSGSKDNLQDPGLSVLTDETGSSKEHQESADSATETSSELLPSTAHILPRNLASENYMDDTPKSLDAPMKSLSSNQKVPESKILLDSNLEHISQGDPALSPDTGMAVEETPETSNAQLQNVALNIVECPLWVALEGKSLEMQPEQDSGETNMMDILIEQSVELDSRTLPLERGPEPDLFNSRVPKSAIYRVDGHNQITSHELGAPVHPMAQSSESLTKKIPDNDSPSLTSLEILPRVTSNDLVISLAPESFSSAESGPPTNIESDKKEQDSSIIKQFQSKEIGSMAERPLWLALEENTYEKGTEEECLSPFEPTNSAMEKGYEAMGSILQPSGPITAEPPKDTYLQDSETFQLSHPEFEILPPEAFSDTTGSCPGTLQDPAGSGTSLVHDSQRNELDLSTFPEPYVFNLVESLRLAAMEREQERAKAKGLESLDITVDTAAGPTPECAPTKENNRVDWRQKQDKAPHVPLLSPIEDPDFDLNSLKECTPLKEDDFEILVKETDMNEIPLEEVLLNETPLKVADFDELGNEERVEYKKEEPSAVNSERDKGTDNDRTGKLTQSFKSEHLAEELEFEVGQEDVGTVWLASLYMDSG